MNGGGAEFVHQVRLCSRHIGIFLSNFRRVIALYFMLR